MTEQEQRHKGIIDKTEVKECQLWRMPKVDGSHQVNSLRSLNPSEADSEQRKRQQMIEQERQRGFDAGFTAGQQQGYESGKQEWQQQIEKSQQLFETLTQELKQVDELVEHQINELVVMIAKTIVSKELTLNPDVIRKFIHEAITFLPKNTHGVKIHLHPEDKAMLEKDDEEITGVEVVQLIADDDIQQGGCLLEADASFVDQSIEKRMTETLETVFTNEQHMSSE